MTNFFMDTSALAKRYVAEIGSGWIKALTSPAVGNVVVIAYLTTVEMCSVLSRLQRSKHISVVDGTHLRTEFLRHTDTEYIMVPVEDMVLISARDLVAKYPLRTLDAIQLACAIAGANKLGEPLTFLSADTILLNAATAEGFAIDNPLAHP
jgi:uncharacterized protein